MNHQKKIHEKSRFRRYCFSMLYACANKKPSTNAILPMDVTVEMPAENMPIENTCWEITELEGKAVATTKIDQNPVIFISTLLNQGYLFRVDAT